MNVFKPEEKRVVVLCQTCSDNKQLKPANTGIIGHIHGVCSECGKTGAVNRYVDVKYKEVNL